MVVGAACAILAIAFSAVAAGQARDLLRPGFWLFCGAIGAAIGAVVAPLMSWLLLRHVPLGRAILHTAIGTVLGGILGLTLGNPFAGSIVGFGVAAVRLSITAKQRRRLRADDDGASREHR